MLLVVSCTTTWSTTFTLLFAKYSLAQTQRLHFINDTGIFNKQVEIPFSGSMWVHTLLWCCCETGKEWGKQHCLNKTTLTCLGYRLERLVHWVLQNHQSFASRIWVLPIPVHAVVAGPSALYYPQSLFPRVTFQQHPSCWIQGNAHLNDSYTTNTNNQCLYSIYTSKSMLGSKNDIKAWKWMQFIHFSHSQHIPTDKSLFFHHFICFQSGHFARQQLTLQ
jgi:hypothetical protein